MKIPKIPFTILALAPFAPIGSGHHLHPIISTDLLSLEEASDTLGPQFSIPVPSDIYPCGQLTLNLKSIKSFKPDTLIKANPDLKKIWDAGKYIDNAIRSGLAAQSIARQVKAKWPELPVDISVREQPVVQKTSGGVDDILSMVALPQGATGVRENLRADGPTQWKAQIDALLSKLTACIFDDAQFRTYETAWRGVQSLLKQGRIKAGEGIRLKITPADKNSLEMVMERLEEELAQDLPNLMLIDLPFDATQVSIDLLAKVAEFAETMLIPTVCQITPQLFHLKNWTELRKLPLLKHHLDEFAYAKWRKFQATPACRWLGLTCNRYLGREPYGADNPSRYVNFQEKEPLWVSPVWAFGALCAQSVNQYGWPNRFTEYLKMRLTDLPVGDYGGTGPVSTETALDEDRIRQFRECGFTPLVGQLNKDIAMIPREAAASGGSLRDQLLIARIFHFLFRLQENIEPDSADSDPATVVMEALILFWRQTGYEPPDDLNVTTETQGQNNDVTPLVIAMTPPPELWPGSQRLQFTFNW